MHKSKLLFVVLILFALLFPTLIVSVSNSKVSVGNALLLQAINTGNPQTTTSEVNQQCVQTINTSIQNFKDTDLQQKDVSAKSTHFYDVWISSRTDLDLDGYCSKLRLRWDADTDKPSDYVEVEVYYRYENGTVGGPLSSGWYTIYDYEFSMPEYEYMDIVCNVRGLYDFSLVLINGSGTQQTINFGTLTSLTDVPMEPASQDNGLLLMLILIPAISTSISNAQSPFWIIWPVIGIIVFVVVLIGLIYYKSREVGAQPPRPSGFPSTGPTPYVPPGSSARPVPSITCPVCGYVNLPNSHFCERCGNELGAS